MSAQLQNGLPRDDHPPQEALQDPDQSEPPWEGKRHDEVADRSRTGVTGMNHAATPELGERQGPLSPIVGVAPPLDQAGSDERLDELASARRGKREGFDEIARPHATTTVDPLKRGDAGRRATGSRRHPFLYSFAEGHCERPEKVLETLVLPLFPGVRIPIVLPQVPRAHSGSRCEKRARLTHELP
jgi:hypothetical protein